MPAPRKQVVRRALARIMVRPPNRASDGAVTVRQMFGDGARLVRREPIPRQYRAIINWGNSAPIPAAEGVRVFNKPEAVALATNKLRAFNAWKNHVRIPVFTTEPPQPENIWLARTVINGAAGEGIVVIRPDDVNVPPAPLYVQYIPKRDEFRLHVVQGNVVFAQQKKRRAGYEHDRDEKLIRNYENGWVFCVAELATVPEDAKAQAIAAVRTLGLDFGAVDLVMHRDNGRAYVLEVNTAPGLESPTLIEAYKQAFTQMVT